MKKNIFLLTITFFVFLNVKCQNILNEGQLTRLKKSDKMISIQQNRTYSLAGYDDEMLVYQLNIAGKNDFGYSYQADSKIYYDEKKKKIIDKIDLDTNRQKILKIYQQDAITLYHGFYELPDKYRSKFIDELDRGEFLLEYQDFWVEISDETFLVKSYPYHYYDKEFYYSINPEENKLILSDYSSKYLRGSKADSTISVYSFNSSKIDSAFYFCQECIRPQIVNKNIYYGQKFFYIKGADAYDWKVFRSPLNNFEQNELIAEYIEILLISPDGKYILGRKDYYGKSCYLILNIDLKKFNYLIFKNADLYTPFYSKALKTFAFDTPDEIIYIDIPEVYEYNSVGPEAQRQHTSSVENEKFWDQVSK